MMFLECIYYSFILLYIYIRSTTHLSVSTPFIRRSLRSTGVLPPNPEERLLLSNQTRPYLCQGQTHWQRGFLFRQANGEIFHEGLEPNVKKSQPTTHVMTKDHFPHNGQKHMLFCFVRSCDVKRCTLHSTKKLLQIPHFPIE